MISKIFIPIITIALSFIFLTTSASALPEPEHSVRVIGHRGASGYAPENTMAAFKKALELGADMFELDVHSTIDGAIVVIHDADTKRTTGSANLVRFTKLKQLRKLDAGAWKGEEFKGEKIPLLEEVLTWAKDKIQVNIEIKSEGCEKEVVKLIKKLGMEDSTIVTSFHYEYLKKIEKKVPEIVTGALIGKIEDPSDFDEIVEELGVDAVNPKHTLVNKEIVDQMHSKGIQVNVYTVDDPASMKRLIDAGVDGIITDYPDLLIEVLEKKNEDL